MKKPYSTNCELEEFTHAWTFSTLNPPPEESEFYKLKNCIITPHIAGSINNECYRLGRQILKEIKHYLAGENFELEIKKNIVDVIA